MKNIFQFAFDKGVTFRGVQEFFWKWFFSHHLPFFCTMPCERTTENDGYKRIRSYKKEPSESGIVTMIEENANRTRKRAFL